MSNTKPAKTSITFEVSDPSAFYFDLKMLRGGICLLKGLVTLLGEVKEEIRIEDAFHGADDLMSRLAGFVLLDEMDDLFNAASKAAGSVPGGAR
jgi:hypothetical protein